jgi:hypothetical protein
MDLYELISRLAVALNIPAIAVVAENGASHS